ncbi:conjugative relaxase-like TrwC/TraI family protein [Antricoccus suffuscus]|uniref:Conjugative relaxase-like TrwC/TraI family protein n=1 Tax=Antricoccus suffuscus TaxID=1629062 RepID=A0A2T0ZTY3_9ACTN|nr:MobF family relaxase [Antricoccus suffuscus]PRZ39717.1 conjugative relaxase-like TrwC/TraI family protein [Antricoccus suffuscus]
MTVHRIGAGDGYRYYTKMTAAADGARLPGEKLTDYYARSGNPPGMWMGRGAEAMSVAGDVSEAQLGNLLGLGLHPDTGAQLGSRYRVYATVADRIASRVADLASPTEAQIAAITADEERKGERQAVAGFDTTFSPVKSISVAWGLAEPETAAELLEAHRHAVATTIAHLEDHVLTARTGTDGIGHVDVAGVTVAAFEHRTSRAADPDLHTHAVISNKVQARLPDGTRKWLTLDSRSLYKANVALSERYNRVLEDEVSRRLGWEFRVRSDQEPGAVSPIRELAHIPEPLIAAFSRRRQQIEADYTQRVRDYRQKHGHEPPKAVQYELAQAACLAQRPEKVEGSEQSERGTWASLAADILTDTEHTALQAALTRQTPAPVVDQLAGPRVDEIAAKALAALEERRADWTVRHVSAMVQRLTADVHFSSDIARDREVARIVTAVTETAQSSVQVSVPEIVETPPELRRADGTPIWDAPGSARWTTTRLLDAEERLVAAAREDVQAGVDAGQMRTVLASHDLAADQRAAVEQTALADRRVQLLVGPAGTGKTTTMRALVEVWQQAAGRPVRGLAPTAAAASVLRTETGMDGTATIDLWATQRDHGIDDSHFSPGELVIVDEAGMAGTLNLDRVITAARADGAHVLLVGDPRQLAAVAAGGGLRLIQNDVGATMLSTVWRFSGRDPQTGERVIRQWEAEASLALREGHVDAVEAYLEHDRVHAGSRDAVTESVYAAWLRDEEAGLDSVMIAPDNATVQALSDRARADRVTAGVVHGESVRLRNDSAASVGDIIVTRENERRIRVGGDFVKNGDFWTITGIRGDGSLAVSGTHGVTVLPADYVARRVQLGYAMTVHRAQGSTVDSVHAIVDETMSRETLYVAATRGRAANHLYAVTEHILDVEAERAADPNQPARAVLTAVLERSEADPSATEAIRAEQTAADSIASHLQRWEYIADHAKTDHVDATLRRVLPAGATEQLQKDAAWPYLRRYVRWLGSEAPRTVSEAWERSAMTGTKSHAQVLISRMNDAAPTGVQSRAGDGRGGWLPAPVGDGSYSDQLLEAARAKAARLGEMVAVDPPGWAAALGPVPDDPDGRSDWTQRAGNIAAYREAFDVHTEGPLGVEPDEPMQRRAWQHAAAAMPAQTAPTRDDGERRVAGREHESAKYAALSDTELAEQSRAIERDLHRAQRQRRQLAHLQEHYEQHQDGPRERELTKDVEQWRSVLAKLDAAEHAAAGEVSARDVAADLRQQVIAHAAETPTRKRARAAWEQQTDALEERALAANAEASDASDTAYRARAGLPADRGEWAQMRQRAEASLHDIDWRRDDARREDAAERDQMPARLARIDEHEATARGELTQLTAERDERRADIPQPDNDRHAGDDRGHGKNEAEHGRTQEP